MERLVEVEERLEVDPRRPLLLEVRAQFGDDVGIQLGRTGVRLTPSTAASSFSDSAVPGGSLSVSTLRRSV